MSAQPINRDDKFAAIVLPQVLVDNIPRQETPYASDLHASGHCPFPFGMAWQRAVGDLRAKDISDANLYLLAVRHSPAPAVLDHESEQLQIRVWHFYYGLIYAAPRKLYRPPLLITGYGLDDNVSVRRIADLRRAVSGCPAQRIDVEALRTAGQIADHIQQLEGGGTHRRLVRALSAFIAGLEAEQITDRLHQFCRCIDGFICSRPGKGEQDFVGRSTLFVGAGHQETMRVLYRLRSAVEHLRDPVDVLCGALTDHEPRLSYYRRSQVAEQVARHCITRVLTTPTLWSCFADEQIEYFWTKESHDERQRRWGDPVSLSDYPDEHIHAEVLGL